MHYDVVIIGAGMSGLAAGIRLAYFDKRVCIVERHYAYGGLNSYYTLGGRKFDVGLHAVSNFVPPGVRNTPLPKLLRQLRIDRDEFDLRPQGFSEVRFPSHRLRFTNDVERLIQEVAEQFPRQIDNFHRLIEAVRAYDDRRLDAPYESTRAALGGFLDDPLLIEMLLCPIMYYGSAEEHDMDFLQFVIMFKAIFLEGFARPPGGVRTIIKTLVKHFRACGGKLKMRCGVDGLDTDGERVTGVRLETGEILTADAVLSSAGSCETMRLCGADAVDRDPSTPGRLSFVESIAVLDRPPADLGHRATIVFFNDAEKFTYAEPDGLVDLRSGVVCCPNNYDGHEAMEENLFRVTWMANHGLWTGLDDDAYAAAKLDCKLSFLKQAESYAPGLGDHVVATDMFTPRTIERFTGHINGAVYGSPQKHRDGRTHLKNLFLCGTDQGYVGIIGAMLSGIMMANNHVLMDM